MMPAWPGNALVIARASVVSPPPTATPACCGRRPALGELSHGRRVGRRVSAALSSASTASMDPADTARRSAVSPLSPLASSAGIAATWWVLSAQHACWWSPRRQRAVPVGRSPVGMRRSGDPRRSPRYRVRRASGTAPRHRRRRRAPRSRAACAPRRRARRSTHRRRAALRAWACCARATVLRAARCRAGRRDPPTRRAQDVEDPS
jgi:hypothetical protein